MSKPPAYLKNARTGVVFPFSTHLQKLNKNMVPCDKKGKSAFDEVAVDVSAKSETPPNPDGSGLKAAKQAAPEAEIPSTEEPSTSNDVSAERVLVADTTLDKATKPQMLKYAKDAFGVDLDKNRDVKALRDDVLALARAE